MEHVLSHVLLDNIKQLPVQVVPLLIQQITVQTMPHQALMLIQLLQQQQVHQQLDLQLYHVLLVILNVLTVPVQLFVNNVLPVLL